MNINGIREQFADNLFYKRFREDKTGVKTIEILGASFLAKEETLFGKINGDYVEAEVAWYESQSTNINDIFKGIKAPPEAWVYTANDEGEINSNYGHLIYSEEYYDQYNHVFQELTVNPDSRRAIMIYNRPSMHLDFCEDGKNDFVCTNAVAYRVNSGKLDCVVQMRSNDAVFGYKNDRAWQDYVLQNLALDLGLAVGDIYWQVQNLHVYERHFYLVNHFLNTGETHITKSRYKELYPNSEYV